jgi:hypothetical protein
MTMYLNLTLFSEDVRLVKSSKSIKRMPSLHTIHNVRIVDHGKHQISCLERSNITHKLSAELLCQNSVLDQFRA